MSDFLQSVSLPKPLARGAAVKLVPADFSYCGDHLRDYNVVYIQGKKGQLANLDIDCDGIQGSPADDGRCGSSGDTQSITSFQYELEEYGTGQKDLDANIHPYVVFGNVGTKKNWPTFDPKAYGIKPLSVMAVVCGNKLVRTVRTMFHLIACSPSLDLRHLGRRKRRRRRRGHGGRNVPLPRHGLLRQVDERQQRLRPQ